MKEKVFNHFDAKMNTFSTYFIINNNELFSTSNFDFEDSLEDCFYVIRLGSVTNPKIYLYEKKNNEWINQKQYIGNYNSLMNLIVENQNSFVCIRGFSKSSISQFIRMINELKGTNIEFVKLKNQNKQKLVKKKNLLRKQ